MWLGERFAQSHHAIYQGRFVQLILMVAGKCRICRCYDQNAKFYSFILIFSTLWIVHDLIFERKLSKRRLPFTFVYFVSHASAQALRPITFTQRFRTTRHLISIQLLWKPKIFNVEDKRTKFELSKGDLGQFQESCKWSLTRAQLSKHMDLRCF